MWRPIARATLGLAALLLSGTTACVDLGVQNPNDPDASRALSTAGDVEALIAGGYDRWLFVTRYYGPSMMLSNASGQHVAPWANAGMEYYARIPRQPTQNSPSGNSVGNLTSAWYEAYRVIAAMHDGLQQMDAGTISLGDDELRARAYAKYMQGLALGSVALLYDSAFVYDETTDVTSVTLQPYPAVMTAALGYFQQAIDLANGASFTIPDTWMGQDVTAATLVELAHSYRARFRAAVARTPTERAAVDWSAVVADANAGVQADWDWTFDCNVPLFCDASGDQAILYMLFPGWQMQNNWVSGMADQSGNYQAWINTPVLDKRAFLIITPDTRWPQGATETAQKAAPGEYYKVTSGGTRIWSRPDRGTWRWSIYYNTREPWYTAAAVDAAGAIPEVTVEEMQALVAEANYRAGSLAAVADFVNATRTLHGLQATDAGGTNADCVPKLPNGSCGDLWEMFKWEKRLETQFVGPLRIGWYFDGRGWGDLMEGTLLQFPVPYKDFQILGKTAYDYGGVGGPFAAPKGTYGY